jgi:hypothetical protein
VLSKGKDAALVRAGGDFQIDLHFSVEPQKAQEAQTGKTVAVLNLVCAFCVFCAFW